jgi:hypothetical protein
MNGRRSMNVEQGRKEWMEEKRRKGAGGTTFNNSWYGSISVI